MPGAKGCKGGSKEVVFLYLYLKAKRVQVGTKGGAKGVQWVCVWVANTVAYL